MTSTRPAVQLALLLTAGLLLRVVLAVVIFPSSGLRTDIAIQTQWAQQLAAHGPGGFYGSDTYFADYPPVYLYLLWVLGSVGHAWGAITGGPDMTAQLIKVPFIVADLAAGASLYLLGRRAVGQRAGVVAAAAFLFNPAVILDSTIWGQNDALGAIALALGLYFLVADRLEAAAVLAVVAGLVKFQFAFLVPIVALVGIKRAVLRRSADPTTQARLIGTRPDLWRVWRALVAGLATLVALCWPFDLAVYAPGDPAHSLWDRFIAASQFFPGVTQNAFNLWMNPLTNVVGTGQTGLTEGHVVNDQAALLTLGSLAISPQLLGNLLLFAAVAVALLSAVRRDDGPGLVFAALTIAVAFFVLPTRIHERYLYPALALGAALLTAGRPWRIWYVLASAVVFFDLYWVYTLPVGNGGFARAPLLNATVLSAPGIYALSLLSVLLLGWLLFQARSPGQLGRHIPASALPAWGTQAPALGAEPVPAQGAGLVPAEEPGHWPTRSASAVTPESAAAVPPWLATWRVRLRARRPTPAWTVALIAGLSFIAGVIAARIGGPGGPWLWNLDMPKIDYPLAVFFHQSLLHGRLPLWNDQLGLGFPLYAEGQIGAFYPPNWLIFLLPPLSALDVTRILHLTLVGTGAGWLALRLSGSRGGALVAAAVAVLSGGIVAKLEWTNFLVAYAWLPWVLLPLVRRPAPTRRRLVLAGVFWGIQALAGHPNVWVLTGLAAVVILLRRLDLAALGRAVAFGIVGAGVGAVQLIPTLLLTTLSVRSAGLSPTDLFASAAKPFDPLGFAFANAFATGGADGWNLLGTWYPNGSFALLEAGAYVGLPVLMLAAVGLTSRRARPLLLAALVMLAIPFVAAFQPPWWSAIPLVDALRSPVRTYVVVDLMLGLAAAVGLARLPRQRRAGRRAGLLLGAFVTFYVGVLALAAGFPATFEGLWADFSVFYTNQAPAAQRAAMATLTAPFPVLAECAIGLLALVVVWRFRRMPGAAAALVALAVLPLTLFSPAANATGTLGAFSSASTPFVQTLRSLHAHRVLTLGAPGWYAGMPDQLAAAGVPDVHMFSSLDLAASDDLLNALQASDATTTALRQAVGIDVVVTFGQPCPGPVVAHSADVGASICRLPGALHPPYWVPGGAIAPPPARAGLSNAIEPEDAQLQPAVAVETAVAAAVRQWGPDGDTFTVHAPASGWVYVDRAWWPGWITLVDGRLVVPDRALAGQLVPVGPGTHQVDQVLVPWDALLGLLAGLIVLAGAVLWVRREGATREAPRG